MSTRRGALTGLQTLDLPEGDAMHRCGGLGGESLIKDLKEATSVSEDAMHRCGGLGGESLIKDLKEATSVSEDAMHRCLRLKLLSLHQSAKGWGAVGGA